MGDGKFPTRSIEISTGGGGKSFVGFQILGGVDLFEPRFGSSLCGFGWSGGMEPCGEKKSRNQELDHFHGFLELGVEGSDEKEGIRCE